WKVAGKSWSIWQHSNKGRIDGIEADVDLDWVRI
ncbi:glycosyl hydrolase family protein, partial [Pseudomonas savastanoi pv. glycinea str. race 4]